MDGLLGVAGMIIMMWLWIIPENSPRLAPVSFGTVDPLISVQFSSWLLTQALWSPWACVVATLDGYGVFSSATKTSGRLMQKSSMSMLSARKSCSMQGSFLRVPYLRRPIISLSRQRLRGLHESSAQLWPLNGYKHVYIYLFIYLCIHGFEMFWVKTLYPCWTSKQLVNGMFIPLKMVFLGVDPMP